MNKSELELIDLLPITTRAHTPIELALSKGELKNLRTVREFENYDVLLDAIIESGGLGDAHTAFEDALKSCAAYKRWQRSMPYLKDVPQIHAYRNRRHYKDLPAVDRAIRQQGSCLQAGQILYRGGNFTSEHISVSDGPVSTSMHPSVALWHANEVNGQLAILKIAAPRSVLAFVFRTTGPQRLKHEYEVLLQNNLRLEQTSIRSINGMQVRSYDVSGVG